MSGEAQVVAQQLPTAIWLEYSETDCSAAGWPHPRTTSVVVPDWLAFEESGHSLAFVQQLQDTCQWWLLVEECGMEEVINTVVLEQFITWLPAETTEWVQYHCPAPLDKAMQMAEDHLVAKL